MFTCPTCKYELPPQPITVLAAGHECPQRGARNKVSTFVFVPVTK